MFAHLPHFVHIVKFANTFLPHFARRSTFLLNTFFLNMAGIFRFSSVTILQLDQVVLSTNLFFKINVSLPLVTGELIQNTVAVTRETYKLYNIKI